MISLDHCTSVLQHSDWQVPIYNMCHSLARGWEYKCLSSVDIILPPCYFTSHRRTLVVLLSFRGINIIPLNYLLLLRNVLCVAIYVLVMRLRLRFLSKRIANTINYLELWTRGLAVRSKMRPVLS